MNQRSRKLVKLFLCCVMGIIIFTGCTSTDTPTDPVVVDPADPVEEKTELELLAEEYEFFQWHLDDSTTKTVDGVTYDLTSLKQQYGDLYRFVEPLSKEEVEYRFQYLAEHFAALAEKGMYYDYWGIKVDSNEVDFTYTSKVRSYYEPLYKKDFDENIDKYSKYYRYVEKTNGYYEDIPESMSYKDEFYLYTIINVIDSIPFEDKDWFLRAYMYKLDAMLNVHEYLGIEPKFEISLPSKSK